MDNLQVMKGDKKDTSGISIKEEKNNLEQSLFCLSKSGGVHN